MKIGVDGGVLSITDISGAEHRNVSVACCSGTYAVFDFFLWMF